MSNPLDLPPTSVGGIYQGTIRSQLIVHVTLRFPSHLSGGVPAWILNVVSCYLCFLCLFEFAFDPV